MFLHHQPFWRRWNFLISQMQTFYWRLNSCWYLIQCTLKFQLFDTVRKQEIFSENYLSLWKMDSLGNKFYPEIKHLEWISSVWSFHKSCHFSFSWNQVLLVSIFPPIVFVPVVSLDMGHFWSILYCLIFEDFRDFSARYQMEYNRAHLRPWRIWFIAA